MPARIQTIADVTLAGGNIGSCITGFAITPHDTNPAVDANGFYARCIWVGGAGNIALGFDDGTSVVLSAVPVGTLLPVQPKLVKATGTTATLLIGLW